MANALLISLNDRTKTASCKETVALCAKYSIEVSPALVGAGKLVLHRRRVTHTPDNRQAFIAGVAAAPSAWQWDANEVYAVVDLTTEDGHTTGELNLRYETLVKDFIGKYQAGAEAPLVFAVYDLEGHGLAGEGEFNVKVVEPYYITEDQNFHLFKGDPGNSIASIVYKSEDSAGNFIYEFTFTDGTHQDVTMPRGPMGAPSVGSYARNAVTGKYHLVTVVTNGLGQNTIRIDPNGVDTPPSDAAYMMLNGEQTVVGQKTFSLQIIANGGIAGNLTGNVTGNLTGDVAGGIAVPAGKAALVPNVSNVRAYDGNAANTKFVRDALLADTPLFTARIFAEAPGAEWADMAPPTAQRRGAWKLASDFPEAYDSLVQRMNQYMRTTHPNAMGGGYSITDDSQPTYTDIYTNNAKVLVESGQFVSATNFGYPNEDETFEMWFSFYYEEAGFAWNADKWQTIFGPDVDLHYAGEQYVDSNNFVKQRTSKAFFEDSEYTDSDNPKYNVPSLCIGEYYYAGNNYNTKIRLIGSTNGTSNNVTAYGQLGRALVKGKQYIVKFSFDGSKYEATVYSVDGDFDPITVTLYNGTGIKFWNYIVIGNHYGSSQESYMRGQFLLNGTKCIIAGSVRYDGSVDQSRTSTYGTFDSTNRLRIDESHSNTQSMTSNRFYIDTTNRRFMVPLNTRDYDNYLTGITGKLYMKIGK